VSESPGREELGIELIEEREEPSRKERGKDEVPKKNPKRATGRMGGPLRSRDSLTRIAVFIPGAGG
jgi:hypothetical protein